MGGGPLYDIGTVRPSRAERWMARITRPSLDLASFEPLFDKPELVATSGPTG